MMPLTTGYIGLGVLFILLFSGMPIGFAMIFVGFAGFAYLQSLNAGLGMLKLVSYTTFASYDLSIIPLFILMGELFFFAGMSTDLYEALHSWLGRLRGGLAMATVGACAGFAAVCGSSVATASTMGAVALPEMRRYNYESSLATGCIAAGGTIGILIPPSVILVLYGMLTQQSIAKLFAAGFIPGILEALFYIFTIGILCWRNPRLGPPGPAKSLREKFKKLGGVWVVLVLFIIVIGGLYVGVFTPTEAAGVGACGAFIFAVARKRLGWQGFKNSLAATVQTAAMVFIIIAGAMVLGYFLAVSRVPFEIASFIGGLQLNRYVVLIAILMIYILLGCVMDSMAIMLLVTPIFYPLILSLDFDPIYFAILVTRVTEVGMITPPVGMNVYVIAGVARDVPMGTIFRGIVPFLIADICEIALLIAVPQLSLFLPSLMK